MASPVVQECRGLILERTTWRVVSCPFYKFFNFGERHAGRIDWSTATVREKLDGSLMTLYWYAGRWRVASSKLPRGDGRLPTQSAGTERWTMAELFWDTFHHKGYQLPTDSRCCYMFEMTSMANVIVVRYTEANLVCIGARNVETLLELPCEDVAPKYNWETSHAVALKSAEAVQQAARELNPVESEGFVVCDAYFNRLKFKCPAYVALHHLGGNEDRAGGGAAEADPVLRRRKLLDIARNNEGAEFLVYYPQWVDEFDGLVDGLTQLVHHLRTCLGAGPTCSDLCKKPRKDEEDISTLVRDSKLRVLDDAVQRCVARAHTVHAHGRVPQDTSVDAAMTTLSNKQSNAGGDGSATVTLPHDPPLQTQEVPTSENPVGNPFAALMGFESSDEDDGDDVDS